MKQTLIPTETDMSVAGVLGWCIYDKQKYIVLYNPNTKVLSKYPMFKDITTEPKYKDNSEATSFLVEVKLGGNYVPIKYTIDTQEDVDKFVMDLKDMKRIAEVRGQFFI